MATATPAGIAAAERKATVADLVAQIDQQIAAAKKQIVLLTLKISQERQRILELEADLEKTQSLLHQLEEQGYAAGKEAEFASKASALLDHLSQDQDSIKKSQNLIESYRDQVVELEKQILALQKEKYALLAKM